MQPQLFPMKRLILTFAILFACASNAWATAHTPLTTLRAVDALSNAEASQRLPVAFEATVTYFPGYENLLFVQDGDKAIFVLATTDTKLAPSDRVLIKGTTQESFRPIVISKNITVLRHGNLAKPVPASFDELVRAQYDCILVTVHGVVRTAELGWGPSTRVTYLQLLMDGGYIEAIVDSADESALKGLLDADVEVTGIAGGRFDNKMQLSGIILHVSSLESVKVLKRAGAPLSSVPVTSMDKVLAYYHVRDFSQRIRVRGAITYYQPGTAIVLQDGAKSIWVASPVRSPMRIGDIADATGFPDTHDGFLALTHGEIEDSKVWAPVTPQPATWQQLGFWSANKPDAHLYDLVSIEGQVVTEVRGDMQDEYVLTSDGRLFSAVYSHPDAASQLPLPAMKVIPPGSRVRVTGICIIAGANPYNTSQEVPFHILLRSFDDISIVAQPSPVNTRNLLLALGVLLMVVFAVIARSWALERKVRRQTAALALLERRRGRILEDINGSLPLAEILEEITELVSFQLKGVPCWCDVTDGARLGKCPPRLAALRIVQEKIPARSGPPLGVIFAAFNSHAKPSANESEALSRAAGLAALATETRRLYSDLLHRSEFDQLTDIHNRFSLEKLLDAQIDEARLNATVFGLIYIDLDYFKLVNDSHGHQVGDQYLQLATLRLKRQLRPHDMLARLGGDEFAALVPVVRSRAEVEEIAQRLERSFDEPFALEELTLTGSASVGIALYPEDGATRDDLLNAADAAMYIAKNSKRKIEKTLPQSSPIS
jgi:diguanylate cyclase (GGDEF)-like protein